MARCPGLAMPIKVHNDHCVMLHSQRSTVHERSGSGNIL